MSNVPTINVDDVAEFGERVPPGKYTAMLNACEGKDSKAGKPMAVATFVVQEGPQEGNEITVFYSLTTSKAKNGKTIAGGVAEAKRTFAAIGKPLPSGFAFPLAADHAAKLIASKLKGEKVDILVYKETDRKGATDEDGNVKVYDRSKVVGKSNKTPTEAPDEVFAYEEV